MSAEISTTYFQLNRLTGKFVKVIKTETKQAWRDSIMGYRGKKKCGNKRLIV